MSPERAQPKPFANSWAAEPRRLAGFFIPYKRAILGSFLIGMLTLLCSLPQPFLIMRIVDHSIPYADARSLWTTVLQILALGLMGNFIAWLESYFFAGVEKRILVDLLSRTYGNLLTKDSLFFSLNHSGNLLSRLLGDIGSLSPLMPASISRLIRNFLTAAIILFLLFRIHPGMAMAVSALLPLVALLYLSVGRRLFRAGAHLKARQDRMAVLLQEDLRGIGVTQSFGAEAFKLEYARKAIEEFQEAQRDLSVKETFSSSLFFVVSICTTLVLWGFGGYTAIQGSITVGSLLAFGSYIGMLAGPIGNLLNSNFGIASGLVSLRRLLEVCGHDSSPAIASPKPIGPMPEKIETIVLRDIAFAYPGGKQIFLGLNAEFPSGSISAIIGPNGNGKSTLLRLINRVEKPSSGKIFFGHLDVSELDGPHLRKTMAMVQQEPFLFNTSIRDNLLLGRNDIPKHRLLDVCTMAGLDDLLLSLEGGFDFRVSENGKNLSGGQRQRLHLVRALLGRPEILLLDEFTSSLDPESEERSHRGLRELFQGKIVVLVSHNVLTLRLATRICRLKENGCMEVSYLPESEFDKKNVITRLLEQGNPGLYRQPGLAGPGTLDFRVRTANGASQA